MEPIIPSTSAKPAAGRRKRGCLRPTLGVAGLLLVLLAAFTIFVPLNPIRSALNTLGFVIAGRLHFPSKRIGEVVTDAAGQSFTVFRQVSVDPTGDQPAQPGAVLILHFRVTNMSPEVNQIYSLLPLPLYIGDPGFRSKLFTINGENCQSIYEWDTVQDAEKYVNSVALKTILLRAVPGSVSYQIVTPQPQW